MNKLDRDVRDPMEVLDEVENELGIDVCASCGRLAVVKSLKSVYHVHRDGAILYESGHGHEIQEVRIIKGLDNPELDEKVGADLAESVREELELVMGACREFELESFLTGELTPVCFGPALGNFGVDHMLDGLTEWAPAPLTRQAVEREVEATEEKFSGFVFKIQANMDPKHRDRIAFMRIVSGTYTQGMKMNHVRHRQTSKYL
ncbi:hypothetical protein P4S64_15335 [Vibrio sp. M60_M31a]